MTAVGAETAPPPAARALTDPPPTTPGGSLLGWGWTLVVGAGCAGFYAATCDVDIGGMANLDLMAQRAIWVSGACATGVAGAVLIGAGSVVKAISRLGNRPA